jgi:hypothetical protein
MFLSPLQQPLPPQFEHRLTGNDWAQWSMRPLDAPMVLDVYGHGYSSLFTSSTRLTPTSIQGFLTAQPLFQWLSLGASISLILLVCLSVCLCLCRRDDASLPSLCHQPRVHHSIPNCCFVASRSDTAPSLLSISQSPLLQASPT